MTVPDSLMHTLVEDQMEWQLKEEESMLMKPSLEAYSQLITCNTNNKKRYKIRPTSSQQ